MAKETKPATQPTLGAILRKGREDAAMTQAELAERAGLHHVCISQYEHDVREPGISALRRIARVLGAGFVRGGLLRFFGG